MESIGGKVLSGMRPTHICLLSLDSYRLIAGFEVYTSVGTWYVMIWQKLLTRNIPMRSRHKPKELTVKEQRSEMLTRVLCPVQNVTIVRLEYRLSEAEGTR